MTAHGNRRGGSLRGVSQPVFSGHVQVIVNLFQTDEHSNHMFLNITIQSIDAPSFMVGDMKSFVLDGSGQQLRHVSLNEIKYGIQLAIARVGGGAIPASPSALSRTPIHNFWRMEWELHDHELKAEESGQSAAHPPARTPLPSNQTITNWVIRLA